jgi:hypothetical protein
VIENILKHHKPATTSQSSLLSNQPTPFHVYHFSITSDKDGLQMFFFFQLFHQTSCGLGTKGSK